MAHNGLGLALWRLGQFQEAEREFKKAIYWAGVNEQPQGRFYTNLGWFYLDSLQPRQALKAFESAKSEDPEYFGNYWGIGRVMHELGNNAAAVTALQVALEKGASLEPPASEEIPRLLRQCLDVS
jgi:tetratricopeptide (TPR) repeat protein